eukprot:1578596-Heterocapsa_arctica.AAC.1
METPAATTMAQHRRARLRRQLARAAGRAALTDSAKGYITPEIIHRPPGLPPPAGDMNGMGDMGGKGDFGYKAPTSPDPALRNRSRAERGLQQADAAFMSGQRNARLQISVS